MGSRTSPTGWVDPRSAEDFAAWAAFGEFLGRHQAKREREVAEALAKKAAAPSAGPKESLGAPRDQRSRHTANGQMGAA